MDLYAAFQALPHASSDANFEAVRLSSRRLDFLAKSAEGAPLFLVHDCSQAHFTPSLSTRNLAVQFHSTCHVDEGGATHEGQFAVLICDAGVPELYELFIRCISVTIEQMPQSVGTREIEAVVRSLLNLFRSVSAPGGREVMGLWAELFVIRRAGNIRNAMDRWHADTFERYDFSWTGGVLEVKATQGPSRTHDFSLEQLQCPSGGRGLVISCLLQPLTNGIGVMDLANEIDAALGELPSLRQRLWENLAAALGSDFGPKLDKRFDISFADRNVAFYNMTDIPAPVQPEDPRISSLRFRVDLTTVSSPTSLLALSELREIFS